MAFPHLNTVESGLSSLCSAVSPAFSCARTTVPEIHTLNRRRTRILFISKLDLVSLVSKYGGCESLCERIDFGLEFLKNRFALRQQANLALSHSLVGLLPRLRDEFRFTSKCCFPFHFLLPI